MQYTIQRWANQHLFLARLALVILHTILGYIAYFVALNVADNLQIPWSLVFTPLLISTLLLLHFTEKEAPKITPTALIALRMVFWFFVGVQLSHFADEKISAVTSVHSTFVAHKAAPETTTIAVAPMVNKFLVTWKKLIQRDKKWVKISTDNDLNIILIIVGAVLLVSIIVYLSLALSCVLACSGAEGAAILIILLGILSIFGILYLVTKRINTLLKDTFTKEKDELRQSRKGAKAKAQSADVPKKNTAPIATPKVEKPATAMPKKDVAPSITQKIETPKTPKTPNKKLTPKERRFNRRLDKGVFWAKIITVIVLGGLIIFTILS